MEFNNYYRAFIGSFIYLLSTRVDLSFSVHKLEEFSQILVKYILSDCYICLDTLGTIRPWCWIIIIIWKIHLYMTCLYKIILRPRINLWSSLILVGKVVQILAEVQEHIFSFITVCQLTMAHMFQDHLLNQVQKVITIQHVLQEWLHTFQDVIHKLLNKDSDIVP